MPTYEAHVIYGKHWGDVPGALLIPELYSNFAHFRKDVNEEPKIQYIHANNLLSARYMGRGGCFLIH